MLAQILRSHRLAVAGVVAVGLAVGALAQIALIPPDPCRGGRCRAVRP